MESENGKTALKTDVTGIMDIAIMDLSEVEFISTEGGFINMKYKETEYKNVGLRRVLPFKCPEEFISVVDNEKKEIGIMKSFEGLGEEQVSLIREELSKRYYCPEISEIESIRDKMGYVYFETVVDGREKMFAVKDVSRNIRMIGENRIYIFDVDGNRYLISDASKLNPKGLRKLEPYLF